MARNRKILNRDKLLRRMATTPGITMDEIGAALGGLSRQRVHQMLEDAGLELVKIDTSPIGAIALPKRLPKPMTPAQLTKALTAARIGAEDAALILGLKHGRTVRRWMQDPSSSNHRAISPEQQVAIDVMLDRAARQARPARALA